MSSPPVFSYFILGQAVGVTAAGFFGLSTLSISPFNYVNVAEASYAQGLNVATKATIFSHMIKSRGKPSMIGSVALGVLGLLVAYIHRPVDISVSHSRAIITAGVTLAVSIPHTLIFVVPIYNDLANVPKLPEEQRQASYSAHIKRYFAGNNVRTFLVLTAYFCGLYGLAVS